MANCQHEDAGLCKSCRQNQRENQPVDTELLFNIMQSGTVTIEPAPAKPKRAPRRKAPAKR